MGVENEIDISALALAVPGSSSQSRSAVKPPKHKPGERFLKGPIPMRWLELAGLQPGKSMHVAVALWHLAGMKRNRCVALSGSVLRRLGVSR